MPDQPPVAALSVDQDENIEQIDTLAGQRSAPDEVVSPSTDEEYIEYRKLTDYREPYRISPEYLVGTKKYVGLRPDTPLIAFINAKSGGRVGPALATILYRSLGQSQVFDVTEHRPHHVLSVLWKNLTDAEGSGDAEAGYVRHNLRILVAGGDGTVTWVLGTILELGLSPPPAVAVMPLGTGNDFSFNFGWGTKFQWNWVKPDHLYKTLGMYRKAVPCEMDVWSMTITAPDASYYAQLPYSVHKDKTQPGKVSARFWNYFSVGLDAEAAYGFHHLRETHPRLTFGPAINQAWYSVFSCSTGWFCGSKPIAHKLKLRVRSNTTDASDWKEVVVPPSVRAVVLLNLQSYGGGRDIWGLADSSATSTFQEPIYDDGCIEVLGFNSGWHTAAVMGQISSKIHAHRLAQCREVEMELAATGGAVKGERGIVYMQLDGEPWPQEIPAAAADVPADTKTATSDNNSNTNVWKSLTMLRLGKGRGSVRRRDVEPLRVRVGCGERSTVLVNTKETLGTRQAKFITQRAVTMSKSLSEAMVAGS